MAEQKLIPQNLQIGDRVSKRNQTHQFGFHPGFAPLQGIVVDTRVTSIKTKKGYTRRRFYDVVFDGRSNKPEKNIWAHMLQKIEQEEIK